MIVSLCELCDMREKALAKYNDIQMELEFISLCEEIEKDNEAQIVDMLWGDVEGDVEGEVKLFFEEKLSSLPVDKKFESVLDFWCETAWWWDEEQARRLTEGKLEAIIF